MNINLPNQVTMSRLLLTVVFVVLLSQFSSRDPDAWIMYLSLALFVLAAATDWLDGFLARRRRETTSLGRILDPFVDKVLVCSAFVMFAGPGFLDDQGHNVTLVASWVVVLIVSRELLVSSLRAFCESKGMAFGADYLGKAKTWVQAITAGWIMLFVARGDLYDDKSFASLIALAMIWLTVSLTALSGLNYIYKARWLVLKGGS